VFSFWILQFGIRAGIWVSLPHERAQDLERSRPAVQIWVGERLCGHRSRQESHCCCFLRGRFSPSAVREANAISRIVLGGGSRVYICKQPTKGQLEIRCWNSGFVKARRIEIWFEKTSLCTKALKWERWGRATRFFYAISEDPRNLLWLRLAFLSLPGAHRAREGYQKECPDKWGLSQGETDSRVRLRRLKPSNTRRVLAKCCWVCAQERPNPSYFGNLLKREILVISSYLMVELCILRCWWGSRSFWAF